MILVGCADPARNLYEGIQQNNEIKRTPQEKAITPAPNYDSYQRKIDSGK